MNENHEDIWPLITKKITRRISEKELITLNELLELNPSYKRLLLLLSEVWDLKETINHEEMEKAFDKLMSKRDARTGAVKTDRIK